MANIAQILLYKQEEKLACLLTAYYELSLEKEAFVQAVQNKKFDWLKYVWAFGKNCYGSRRQGDFERLSIQELLKIVSEVFSDQKVAEYCCEQVCLWKMVGNTPEYNILEALLAENQQLLALDYMGYYTHFLDRNLFIFALKKNTSLFMQEALKKQAFETEMYTNPKVVSIILAMFEADGSKTNFILNVLLLTNVA